MLRVRARKTIVSLPPINQHVGIDQARPRDAQSRAKPQHGERFSAIESSWSGLIIASASTAP